ncbi:MAG: two-component regulator propeller domain-containing protein, partial [Fulvivirga sp.]|nr:two-component regulator propeller domain-containing protein [Fulvivirga sp.]
MPYMGMSNVWAQSYNFTNYDIGDGLVHDKVMDIAEDRYGNLWVASLLGGISKFNGVAFENFTIREGLASNFVRDLVVDQEGNIWAATAMGLSMYDGHTFKNYKLDQENELNNSINVIADGSKYIWFAAPDGGIGSLNPSTGDINIFAIGEDQLKNDKVIALEVDEQGIVWFITVVNGLYRFDGKNFTNVIRNVDFKGYLLSVYIDEDGLFWLGSNKGLLKYNPKSPGRIDDFFKPLKDIFIKSALVKDSTDFWALSAFGALKINNGVYKTMTKQEGLTNERINVIHCDREGSFWAGTDGEGIFKLVNETFVRFTAAHGISENPVTTILKDENSNYYFGTLGSGVDVYDGKSFTKLNMGYERGSSYISCGTIDKQGNLWFGTRGAGV